MLRYMASRNVKILNQILNFWNLWVKGFQTVYRLSKSVDILEAFPSEVTWPKQESYTYEILAYVTESILFWILVFILIVPTVTEP